jgi:hypothetical protein
VIQSVLQTPQKGMHMVKGVYPELGLEGRPRVTALHGRVGDVPAASQERQHVPRGITILMR